MPSSNPGISNHSYGVKKNGKEKMKPFAEKLKDDEIKALVAHVRSLKK